MKLPRLTSLLVLLAVGALVAGCAAPSESAADNEQDETAGNGGATNETGEVQPTLPGFDAGAGAGSSGNATASG